MAEPGQNNIASKDWGNPLPKVEEVTLPEEDATLTTEDLQVGALLSLAKSFDRIATSLERLTTLAEKEAKN